jgi:glycosyltransferase involved in cell wall biosynthesis
MDISVILPVINERDNLLVLLPRIQASLEREKLSYEIIVVDGNSIDGTREAAEDLGARVVRERRRGFAGALETGFAEAAGDYVLTLDADLSHDPDFIGKMWVARHRGDIVVASRYTRGGVVYTSFIRRWTSFLLNLVLGRMLSIPVRDMSSGFRLYRREALRELKLISENLEVQEEILVRAYARGFSIVEVPFVYFPRATGRSHTRLISFGLDILFSSLKLWKVRNSLESADYDERGFYSIIPIQRYWHRSRHQIAVNWARGSGRILDAGCGSSLIIQSLNNAVGMDFNLGKLRFLRRYGMPLVRGSAFALPFADNSFDCVISQEVIEHLPYDEGIFQEMSRVLKPGGIVLLGTPDYATWVWRTIEPIYGFLMPGGYKDEHITHFTRESLTEVMVRHGFAVEAVAYVGGSDLLIKCRKLEQRAHGAVAAPTSSAA